MSGPHLLLVLGSAPHRELAVSTLWRAAGRLTLLDAAQSPFARLSDRVVVLADPRDPRSVALALRRAARARPDAIIAFNDAYLEAVGEANATLGLRGITAAAARRAYHKDQMRSALRDGGVAVPDFRVVADREHARLAAAGLGYPVCVKPSNRSAGLGGGGGLRQPLRQPSVAARDQRARRFGERLPAGQAEG